MKLKIRYLLWRDGRPRWEPGPHLRKKGWKGRDLKDDGGRWLALNEAINQANRLNDEVDKWRAGRGVTSPPVEKRSTARTCLHMWETYQCSPKFQKLASATRDDYTRKMGAFLADFGQEPVAAIDAAHLYKWWEQAVSGRGHHMANGVIAVVRAVFSHGRRIGWRMDNPARDLGIEGVAPRTVLWTPDEVLHAVRTADGMGLHSIGDGIITALHSGQRRGDVLNLPEYIFEDARIALSQAKTGAMVDAPMSSALAARVAAIRERKKLRNVVRISTLIVRDDTGEPHDDDSFYRNFRIVRMRAAETMPSLTARPFVCIRKHRGSVETMPDAGRRWHQHWEPMTEVPDNAPTWEGGGDYEKGMVIMSPGRRFQDLRDTAVTRLALATQCDMALISSITGHSLKSITQILKHYLVMQPSMADDAIGMLNEWLEKKGIAL